MDKGSKGNKPSSIPLIIRFNAEEESVEDFFSQSNIPSSSPQQADDFSWKKDFLQGNFFHRKRSESAEGESSPSYNSINNISTAETNTVGTWKLIKGKVSQAMEDIKQSKSSHLPNKGDNNDDSDFETATIDSSISDDFSLDAQSKENKPKLTENQSDSDVDIENNIFLNNDEIEISLLRKSLAHLCSKKSLKPKEESPNRNVSNIRTNFLKQRKKQNTDIKNGKTVTNTPKKDVEIESGVEVLEHMILQANKNNLIINSYNDNNEKSELNISSNLHKGTTKNESDNIALLSDTDINNLKKSSNLLKISDNIISNNNHSNGYSKNIIDLFNNGTSLFISALFILIFVVPLPDFIRGIFACILTIMLFDIFKHILNTMVIKKLENGSEKQKFQIPDYTKMPICEIPAVKEHKSLKSYSGWMCEVNNYDPMNFHISMTRAVFLRLDGSTLRISNTTARIPKRAMWNETLIDKDLITFTHNRCYNLRDCNIEMCPRGLARKRYFSRKYPILLIISNNNKSSAHDENNIGFDKKTMLSQESNIILKNDSSKAIEKLGRKNSNDLNYEQPEIISIDEIENELDFGTTILTSDLQKLQVIDEFYTKENVPSGDVIRLFLFARSDREKEDWYRRFYAASKGMINDEELHIPEIVFITDNEIEQALKDTTDGMEDKNNDENICDSKTTNSFSNLFEGLLMSSCAARNPYDYIKFMSVYQNACVQKSIPVIKTSLLPTDTPKRNRRQKKQEDDLWKGIDQSLYLGPSVSVVWANVLIGRVIFSCLNDTILLEKIKDFLQKKLSAIKLPSFMEDVVIAQVNLGNTPPLIHRISQPLLDERGIWLDADITYEGLVHMTITTKLNLLRLKRQANQSQANYNSISQNIEKLNNNNSGVNNNHFDFQHNKTNDIINETSITNNAIYDSDAESSGGSSTESESPALGNIDTTSESPNVYSTPGGSKRFLKIVDRITASNLFQSATDISYIQRAMENMSTKITLRVELKGLVGRVMINIPPPPSDRIWLSFRGPPRLWISAKPAVGEHTFDWIIVTNIIESKLCDEVYKYLVYPNMVDIISPFLGESTYKE